LWSGSVSPGHSALDFHGTAHCVDRARKFDQGTITRGLHDAAAMLGNLMKAPMSAFGQKRTYSWFNAMSAKCQ